MASWKEYTDNSTRGLIAESLRRLMLTKPFESIRIKDICDEVGVVRVTFYNYFIDKFDTLDYLIKIDLIQPNEDLARQGKFDEILENMIHTIYEKKDFYRAAYEVKGQNGFEEQMRSNLSYLFLIVLRANGGTGLSGVNLSDKVTAAYFAEMVVYGVQVWLTYPKELTADEAFKYMTGLANYSIRDMAYGVHRIEQ